MEVQKEWSARVNEKVKAAKECENIEKWINGDAKR